MLRANFRIAIRNLLRQKVYSIINVFGLLFGLTCCLLISLYIHYEFSYESFHQQNEQIYRVVEDAIVSDAQISRSSIKGAAGPALEREFPQVQHVVRFIGATMLMSYEQKRFQEDKIFFADSTVFDVFTIPLINGDPRSALSAPMSIVLSKTTAQKYFGDNDPIGRTLLIDNEIPFTVTGVFQDLPHNTHLKYDILLSMSTREQEWLDGWSWSSYTYVLLAPGADAKKMEKSFPEFVARHTGSTKWPEEEQVALSLQPLKDLHLYSRRSGEPGVPGSLSNLYLFTFIAIFILVIACINFVNLATVQAGRRSKEIGVRKVIGGTRLQLALQFLSEAVILSLIAAFLAIGLCDLLLPLFNELSGVAITLEPLTNGWAMAIYVGLSFLTGCVAGSYPAILLSRFHPLRALKGTFKSSPQGNSLRKALIVLQFSISMILVASTITLLTQLRYLREHDLGYFHDQQVMVLYFGDDSGVQDKIEPIKQELLRSAFVDRIAASSNVPGFGAGNAGVEIKSDDGILRNVDVRLVAADRDYIPFYGIQIIEGKNFSHSETDKGAFLVNETAAIQLGFSDYRAIIGKELVVNGQKGMIIGVTNDFNYESLHKRISPLVIRMRHKSLSYLSLSVQTKATRETIEDIEKRWDDLAPHRPFEFFFLDENFDRLYSADKKFGKIFGAFAIVAIVLAVLGLFGLTSFTAQERIKEIGIRKTLGASVVEVVILLSRDLLKLVCLAVIIAIPLAWFSMEHWLQDFAYRIDIELWIFVVAGATVFFIAAFTVSCQSIKAAKANPVDSLRET